MSKSEHDLKVQRGLLKTVGGIAAVIAVAGPLALFLIGVFGPDDLDTLDAYSLPILLIGGIVMFLLALCLVVIVFQRLGLASTNYALGLPEGSIRAFIALSLILLFFMMGVYLYTGISKQGGEVLRGLSAPEAAAVPDERVAFTVTRGALVDVHLNPASAAAEDVARQMITTMSTLVVAIAAFYFGTSSVQQALDSRNVGGGGAPALALLEPQNTPRALRRKPDGGWEPETIRLQSTPADAQVAGAVEGDAESTLSAVDDSGLFTYRPSQPSPEGVTVKFSLGAHKEVAKTVRYQVPAEGEATGESPEPGGDAGEPGGGAGEPAGGGVDPAGGVDPGGGVDPRGGVEQPVVEQPVVEQPVVEQPVVEQPVVDRPAEGRP